MYSDELTGLSSLAFEIPGQYFLSNFTAMQNIDMPSSTCSDNFIHSLLSSTEDQLETSHHTTTNFPAATVPIRHDLMSTNFSSTIQPAAAASLLMIHSGNCTSDEADHDQEEEEEQEQQSKLINDDRKRRRMISNRESARRSRMRKQRYIDELWSQVMRLRAENQELIDRLNCATETHDRILVENARLKQEASSLRDMVVSNNNNNNNVNVHQQLQHAPAAASPDYSVLSDFTAELLCNSAHLRADHQSMGSSNQTSNILKLEI